jgi:hypothetical protein
MSAFVTTVFGKRRMARRILATAMLGVLHQQCMAISAYGDRFDQDQPSWRQTLAHSGVRALWELRRHAFEAGFVVFMDTLMAEAPRSGASDFLAAWKSEVETQNTR